MTRRLAIVAVLIASTGCGFFSRAKSSFYSIDTVPGTAAARVTNLPVAIEVLELPPGADRREIIVRDREGGVVIRERDQWTASLEPLALHTLAHDLALRLPQGTVVLPGQPVPNGPMRAFDVIVEDIAAGPDNQLRIAARWTLRERNTNIASRREEIIVPLSSLASQQIASGYTTALAQLADRLVAALP